MKKKLIIMGIAATLVICGVVGGTMAGKVVRTEKKAVAEINLKALGIELSDSSADGKASSVKSSEILAGGLPGETYEFDTDKVIVNYHEKGSEYTLYTRVTIDKQWDDAITALSDAETVNIGEDGKYLTDLKPKKTADTPKDDKSDADASDADKDETKAEETKTEEIKERPEFKVSAEDMNVAEADAKLSADDFDPQYITLLVRDSATASDENPKGTLKNLADCEGQVINGWYIHDVTDEQIVMYYTKPLTPNEKTTSFISGISFDINMTNVYAGKSIKLNYTADAVQFDVINSAMPAEWGVYPQWVKDAEGKDTTTIEKILE